jgi:transposase InsO family protein
MLKWAAEHNVRLHFIDPGKPMQNGQVESFNGRVRDELQRPSTTQRTYLTPTKFIKSIANQPTQQLSAA